MSSDFVIRRCGPYDSRSIYELICDMEARNLPWETFNSIYVSQLANPNFVCLICEQDGQVAGSINLRMEYQLHHAERVAEIMELVVRARYRSRGIGGKLLAEACKTAASDGCGQIEVCCNQLRTDAHRFYAREGMNPFHFKFSRRLTGETEAENHLGL